jgi:lycopene beta-cyclase
MRLDVEYALVGGGLQNGLIALALRAAQPGARIAIIERGATLGGNHTWCFHAGDLSASARSWIEPLIAHRWPGYEVAFPDHRRRLGSEYACITAERFHQVVSAALGAAAPRAGSDDGAEGHAPPGIGHLLLAHDAEVVSETLVLARPRNQPEAAAVELHASAVIDARGPDRDGFTGGAGYQKFVGQELRCAAPHGLREPILMDATVAQLDGFRFLYVLPLSADRLLVEDTVFSDSAYLDVDEFRARIAAYTAARGWRTDGAAALVREETGVLPLPWHVELSAPTRPLTAGFAGGWFHPVTGYSFPLALRVAEAVAHTPATALPGSRIEELWRRHRRQLGFALRLNWMMFRWFAPADRYHLLARFYRLPEATIRRFYALELSALDRARLIVGRPPRGISWRAVISPAPPSPAPAASSTTTASPPTSAQPPALRGAAPHSIAARPERLAKEPP